MEQVVKNGRQNLHSPELIACLAGLLLLALLFPGSVFAADFDRGRDAFRSGDFQQALREWQPLAQTGDASAQYALGLMHEYGRGLERDDVKAANWYKKAAEQDVPDAQYRLGVLYENGWGLASDSKEAAHWYLKAARHGHAFAQHDLAFMHLEGKGVSVDRVQAYKWLRIASERRASVMAKHLYSVSKMLSPDEIRLAEKLAQEWLLARK